MTRLAFFRGLAAALGRDPTDEERAAFLSVMANEVGGEYVYVPKLPQSQPIDIERIQVLRAAGFSIRRIAKDVRCSKSQVHRALSQLSPYVVDKEAA